ncbi:NAD(P)-dependent alcohol dehydrogenase [Solimonas soli]|uniref:NAD(P)-dependent alcohol dehydrogenase n=1 Tax=Solimonas soli TaxID=413479 RepID=UPI000485CD77|nr:NAD(P)-dependent alcohol dehydrogenase [Solimonas soli]
MTAALGYAAEIAKAPLVPFTFERRATGPRDVRIEIAYCGVCHSDLHQVRDEWGHGIFPMVPGHEIVGRVIEVGAQVRQFKAGDLAGVGCMVDSCRSCASCRDGLEQYCEQGFTGTYNGRERDTRQPTYGGYSNHIVVDEAFVLRISPRLDLAATAPLLCAGITTYSPLRHWKVGPGQKVGVVGLGGLGHMALKFAHAFGAEVVLFTTSPGKEADARRLGASDVVISKNKDEMNRHARSFDFIIDTVSAPHDINAYLGLLRRDGTMTLIGVPDTPPTLQFQHLIFSRRKLGGSLIGGIAETQEMLDFCAERGIVSDIELIPMQKINEAYERMLKSDVKYRFVLDIATLAG